MTQEHSTDTVLLTIQEASQVVPIAPATWRDWILRKRFPYLKIGRRVFVRLADIQALLAASLVPAANSTKKDQLKSTNRTTRGSEESVTDPSASKGTSS